MEIVHPLAEAYAERFSTPGNELLKEIYQHTISTHDHAHMISSEVQGRVLQLFSKLISPKYILEVGTFTGYSALCLCEGLRSDGELHTIELREPDALQAKAFFKRSKWNDQIHLHIGNAIEIIPTLDRKWDLVFIDADKTGYIDHYELLVPLLPKNAYIIADNVLFHGQVLENNISGKNAKAIHAFNEHVANDNRTEQVMLTIRDGLLIIKKTTE